MKKIFKYVPIILGFVMVMSSCGEDDETEPAVVAPSLNYSVDGSSDLASYEVTQGATVEIAITANKVGTGKDLDLISISQNGSNVSNSMMFTVGNNTYDFSTGTEQTIRNADDETFSVSGTFSNISSNVGITTYTIVVKDRDGTATTKSFDIEVKAASVALATVKNGQFYHVGGSLRGAWNVSTDTSVAAGTSPMGAILTNTDAAGDPFTGAFSLTGGDMVVAAASFDYDAASDVSTAAAYNAGTAQTSMGAPSVGDVYIIRMTSGAYAVVKVETNDASDNTCMCGNTGKLAFEYKKM